MSDLALQAVGLAAVLFHAVPAGISTDIAAGMLEMAGAYRVFPEDLLSADGTAYFTLPQMRSSSHGSF